MRLRLALTVPAITGILVVATAQVPGAADPLPPGGTFRDDDGNVHEGNIEAIAAEGITLGCNPPANDLYCPDRILKRGEMAALLARTLNLPPAPADRFVDDDDSVFEDDINRLFEAGITHGCNPPVNDLYCPDRQLSRGEIAAFLVRAFGYNDPGAGDWFIDDDDSVFENDIDRLRVAGVTLGCNPPDNTRFCPEDPLPRDEMASLLARAADLDPLAPPPRLSPTLEMVVTGLSSPTHVASPPGDDRLFIVEKRGAIRIYENGHLQPGFFLDLRATTRTSGEAGLLSIAFHPQYAQNGRFFVYQSRPLRAGGSGNHTSYVYEFSVSGDRNVAAPATRREVLVLDQPAGNHNGGQIEFGPGGYLWIGLGDGGGAHDEFANGQDLDTLHGALLRIDVDGAAPYAIPADNPFVGEAGRDEIWAYGLRNPWRWTFYDGWLYVADVGQNAREEVDVVPLSEPGANFGWCLWEGSLDHSHPAGDQCDAPGVGLTFPVVEPSHGDGNCSITGGRVYEGSELPDLVGHYFYVDLCLGHLSSFKLVDGAVSESVDWTTELGTQGGVWSFGSDASGNLYLVYGNAGEIRRLTGE